jgi:NADH-quinone oxidoreductase subunit C
MELYKIVYFLKHLGIYNSIMLSNIFCLDTMNTDRYILYYSMASPKFRTRVFVKVKVPETKRVPSIINFFYSANWLEREICDLFGVIFYNHTDLRRILTDYGFDGNPLKKDFPVTGFFEVSYDVELKSVIYTFLETTQELRFYDFSSPWEKSYF